MKYKEKINYYIVRLLELLKFFFYKKTILIEGFPEGKNFGDYLNRPLTEFLSGKKLIVAKLLPNKIRFSRQRFSVIGSIIENLPDDTQVWGSGFLFENSILNKNLVFHAVRGSLSAKKSKNDIALGDPALLLPLMYNKEIPKKYKTSIIPHYVDKNQSSFLRLKDDLDAIFIDIECGNKYKDFIDEILRSELVITSSLHGVIVCFAYKVPVVWVKFSNKLLGNDFKFYDFYQSLGLFNVSPYIINDYANVPDLVPQIPIDTYFNLEPLILSCPFIRDELKFSLLKRI
jgi:pyruvyltransferase